MESLLRVRFSMGMPVDALFSDFATHLGLLIVELMLLLL